jgi:hypothetical protein
MGNWMVRFSRLAKFRHQQLSWPSFFFSQKQADLFHQNDFSHVVVAFLKLADSILLICAREGGLHGFILIG